MRKFIFTKIVLITIISLFATEIYSQGFYANVGAGYGLPFLNHRQSYSVDVQNNNGTTHIFNGTSTSTTNTSVSTSTYKVLKGMGSYGKGIQTGVTIGYMFNKNVGAELGISYLIGSEINTYKNTTTTTYKVYYYDMTNHANDTTGTSTASSVSEYNNKAQMLRFIPALRISLGEGSFRPYAKLGLVIGLTTKFGFTYDYQYTNTSGNVRLSEQEIEYTGGISIGAAGAIGANYYITDNIGIFAEVGVIAQEHAPKKSELVKYTDDGVDQLDTYTTSMKETEFVDEYTVTSPNASQDSPNKSLKQYHPFSSIGLNIGVTFAFGGK